MDPAIRAFPSRDHIRVVAEQQPWAGFVEPELLVFIRAFKHDVFCAQALPVFYISIIWVHLSGVYPLVLVCPLVEPAAHPRKLEQRVSLPSRIDAQRRAPVSTPRARAKPGWRKPDSE